MTSSETDTDAQERRMTSGQWFILLLLILLNVAVVVLLALALSGRLSI